MYKGNMYEFVDILRTYLRENGYPKMRLEIRSGKRLQDGKFLIPAYYLVCEVKGGSWNVVHDISDTEDFEEQVIKVVKNESKMKDYNENIYEFLEALKKYLSDKGIIDLNSLEWHNSGQLWLSLLTGSGLLIKIVPLKDDEEFEENVISIIKELIEEIKT